MTKMNAQRCLHSVMHIQSILQGICMVHYYVPVRGSWRAFKNKRKCVQLNSKQKERVQNKYTA